MEVAITACPYEPTEAIVTSSFSLEISSSDRSISAINHQFATAVLGKKSPSYPRHTLPGVFDCTSPGAPWTERRGRILCYNSMTPAVTICF
jgi:hypothetical protein